MSYSRVLRYALREEKAKQSLPVPLITTHTCKLATQPHLALQLHLHCEELGKETCRLPDLHPFTYLFQVPSGADVVGVPSEAVWPT